MDAAPLSTDAALAMRRRTSDLGSHSASWTPASPASALIASPAASMLGRHRCCAAQQRGGKDGLIAYRCATSRVQHLRCRLQRAGRSSVVRIRYGALAQIHGGYQHACWLSRASTESTPVGYFNPLPDWQH